MLGQIHKKQTPIVPARKPPLPDKQADKTTPERAQSSSPSQPAPVEPPKPAGEGVSKSHDPLPLKCYFLLVSIGLFVSTLSGLYMSCKYIRNTQLITVILLGGIIIPVLLTVF
jgi:hypothetical protein